MDRAVRSPCGVPKVCWACELRRYAKVSPQAEVPPVIRGQRGEDEFGDCGHVGRVRVVGRFRAGIGESPGVHGAADQAW